MKTKVIQNDPDGGAITGAPPPAAVPARPRAARPGGRGGPSRPPSAPARSPAAARSSASTRPSATATGFYAAETRHARHAHARAGVPRPRRGHRGPRLAAGATGRLGRRAAWPPPERATDPSSSASARARTSTPTSTASPTQSTDFGGGGDGAASPRPATGAPAPPASQGFWAQSAAGAGTQTVVWPVEKGDWAAVVMNADGIGGRARETRLAVKTDLVLWLGVGVLVAGAALAGAGTALIASAAGARRRRADATT